MTQIPALSALTVGRGSQLEICAVDEDFYSFSREWLVVGAREEGEVSGEGEEPGRNPHILDLGRRRKPEHWRWSDQPAAKSGGNPRDVYLL